MYFLATSLVFSSEAISTRFARLAGATSYWALVSYIGVTKIWAAVICVVVTVGLRRWSLKYNVLSPADVDLTPHVMRSVNKLRHKTQKPGKQPEQNGPSK